MLDSNGFDKWSGEYDETIVNSKGYPFEGYYDVLGSVQGKIELTEGTKILDLGIGTGALTNELYKSGAQIYGADFSEGMIKQARKKMPQAEFYCFDFACGLPSALRSLKYNYIVSSYAIHHIDFASKIDFIVELKKCLKENGRILFADVAFESRDALENCKLTSGNSWDASEHYMIGSDMVDALREKNIDASYRQISNCAGILEVC